MEAYRQIRMAILMALTVTVFACGGGGGGDSSGISYSGREAPAVLTAENDNGFGEPMMEGGTKSDAANPLTSLQGSGAGKNHLNILDILANQFKTDIEQRPESSGGAVAFIGQDPNGSCGGTFSYNSNETSGNITYNNYCIGVSGSTEQVVLNGTMSYTYEGTETNFTITISYNNFTVTATYGDETFTETIAGNITMTNNNGEFTITFTSLFEQNGLVYRVDNLNVTHSFDGSSISGTFYHPNEGHVQISTTVPFQVQPNGDFCGGTLLIMGEDSAGDPVSSEMTINADCSEYTITFINDQDNPEVVVWH